MDTGKIPFGTELYLVVKNPYRYEECCPCCGHKFEKTEEKWLILKGTYDRMDIDGNRLLYYAHYINPKTQKYDCVLINMYYTDQKDSKDVDIFERWCEGWGGNAFRTKKEAEEYIKEYGEDENLF